MGWPLSNISAIALKLFYFLEKKMYYCRLKYIGVIYFITDDVYCRWVYLREKVSYRIYLKTSKTIKHRYYSCQVFSLQTLYNRMPIFLHLIIFPLYCSIISHCNTTNSGSRYQAFTTLKAALETWHLLIPRGGPCVEYSKYLYPYKSWNCSWKQNHDLEIQVAKIQTISSEK